MLACDRIRIVAAFSSGKVMAKLENSPVFLSCYTCYENQQSSCRLCSSFIRISSLRSLARPLDTAYCFSSETLRFSSGCGALGLHCTVLIGLEPIIARPVKVCPLRVAELSPH